MRFRLLASASLFVVTSCGDGGGGSPPAPIVVNPAPTPSPTPAPTPTNPPSPLPGTGAGTIEFLHTFGVQEGDGFQPNGPLLLASDGNFYGTTKQGGSPCDNKEFSAELGCGVIFRVTPNGTESVVYRFKGGPSDGRTPYSGLIQGSDGALYGTTTQGGANERGIAFRLTLSGDYKILHHFDGARATGDRPIGKLLQASDGVLYGATIGGGPNNCSGGDCGTIYRLTLGGEYRVIYNFGSQAGDGAVPTGSLIEGDDGALYGATVVGGDDTCSDPNLLPRIAGCGTIFRISKFGSFTVLHAFGPTTANGILPSSGLTRGTDGAFYGATARGGAGICINSNGGCGTIFRITPAGVFSLVYQFSLSSTQLPGETAPGSDGFTPNGDLWFNRDGVLYGATAAGGVTTSSDTGTLYSLTTSGSKTILYRFASSQNGPAVPVGGLVEGAEGVFWGVTNYNGGLGGVGARTGFGALFRITVPMRP